MKSHGGWEPDSSNESEVLRYYAEQGGVVLEMTANWWRQANNPNLPFPGWPKIRDAASVAVNNRWAVILKDGYADTISQAGIEEALLRGLTVKEGLLKRQASVEELLGVVKSIDPDATISEGPRPGFPQYAIHVVPSKVGLRSQFTEAILVAGYCNCGLSYTDYQGGKLPFWVIPEKVDYAKYPAMQPRKPDWWSIVT